MVKSLGHSPGIRVHASHAQQSELDSLTHNLVSHGVAMVVPSMF